VIDSGGWETGEESARCQRERNKGEGARGDGAVEMTKGGDVAFLRERLRMGLEYEYDTNRKRWTREMGMVATHI
jgi:hypothetical protein